MISTIFSFFVSLAQTSLEIFGALGRGLLDILSALASVILWPFRAMWGILFGSWDLTSPWTPLYFLVCLVLLLALAAFAVWALWVNHKRKKGQ